MPPTPFAVFPAQPLQAAHPASLLILLQLCQHKMGKSVGTPSFPPPPHLGLAIADLLQGALTEKEGGSTCHSAEHSTAGWANSNAQLAAMVRHGREHSVCMSSRHPPAPTDTSWSLLSVPARSWATTEGMAAGGWEPARPYRIREAGRPRKQCRQEARKRDLLPAGPHPQTKNRNTRQPKGQKCAGVVISGNVPVL